MRLPEARAAQAALAETYGIYGFCYYHYWFDGRQVLERPVNEILKTGEPDFPFCLCWANENWTRQWDGLESHVLLAQKYSPSDDLAHIRNLIPFFLDPRYIRVSEHPLFLVYRAKQLPEPRRTAELWRREAERAGLPGLYLVRVESFEDECGDPRDIGFDAALEFQPRASLSGARIYRRKWWHIRRLGTHEPGLRENIVFDYRRLVTNALAASPATYHRIPGVCPCWDNSPRRGSGAQILINSTPEHYEFWLNSVVNRLNSDVAAGLSVQPLLFINAWNEWGEGNHLEPCQKWGRKYLEATGRALGTKILQAVGNAKS
jgi:lipopolysaccharide biosynthesis protein